MKSKISAIFAGVLIVLAVMVLCPAAGSGTPTPQISPTYAEQKMNQLYQSMTSNVTQIYGPVSEIDRWQANLAMWHLVLAHLNDPQDLNVGMLSDTFRTMQANVLRIMQNAERERWEYNVNLWQLYVGRLENPTVLTMSQFNAALGAMDANVCCITDAAEHERWQANHDMWQLMVARLAGQGVMLSTR